MTKTKYTTLLCGLFVLFATFAYNNASKKTNIGSYLLEVPDEKSIEIIDKSSPTLSNVNKEALQTNSCLPITTLPFKETFNSNSLTKSCWTILDTNADSTSPTGSDIWKTISYSTYEGDGTMYFYGSGKANDDYLISPTFTLTGGLYELSFYYRTNTYDNNEFELLYSTTGITSTDFVHVLAPRKTEKLGNYIKAIYYLENITGNVNIAWHTVSNGSTSIYVDEVGLEAVSCKAPNLLVNLDSVATDKATFSWEDNNNQSWEYYVSTSTGQLPIGSGSFTTNKTITVNRTSGTNSTALQSNTLYYFYLRSSCAGTNKSKWLGPYSFRTTCATQSLPFTENFDTTSTTLSCWSTPTIDSKGNTISNYWKTNTTNYQGTHAMHYYGGPNNDAWLISPTFSLDIKKTYRLKYRYRTSSSYKNNYSVLLSSTGTNIKEFKTVLLEKKQHSNNDWTEEKVIIHNTNGSINLAWHANTPNSNMYIYIDNVSLEEVNCTDPTQLAVKNIKLDEATLSWKEDIGSNWEYVVQEKGLGLPKNSGKTTSSKTITVKQDNKGKSIQANTAYEFYVRTVCGTNIYSDWTGPYDFRTLCDIQSIPFWEGFNGDSASVDCWSILDENKDGGDTTGQWKRHMSDQYEGTTVMRLQVYDYSNAIQTNDWLVSPAFPLKKGKVYRLKYHYKGALNNDKNLVEVFASTNGNQAINFTKQIVEQKTYNSNQYQEQKAFIHNLNGTTYLGWHVSGTGNKEVYIDNVFVEEVQGCPEPLNLSVNNITNKQVDIAWTDDMGGTSWEYLIQEVGDPKPTTAGTLTNTKQVTITKDQKGNALKGNTAYELYVRTACSKGSYSIWTEPISFYTACDNYTLPFHESFDSTSKSLRCWTTVDGNNNATSYGTNYWKPSTDSSFNGDQSMMFVGNGAPCNDWSITPALDLEGGTYILKYQYKADPKYDNELRVALSSNGTDITQFTTELMKQKNIKTAKYIEEVIFFTAPKGVSHIGWQLVTNGASTVSIDQVSIKKTDSCMEPYNVEINNTTATTADLNWKQQGTVTNWEIIVVPYGQSYSATPITTTQVQGTPSTTLTNLPSGRAYSIYVRANCGSNKYSEWSTAATLGLLAGTNDDCTNALTIPINNAEQCILKLSSTLNGSTISSSVPTPTCSGNMQEDMWYQFTATSTAHMLTLDQVVSFSGATNDYYIAAALYDTTCTTMTNTAKACFTFRPVKTFWVMQDLIVGQTYTLRLGGTTAKADYYFDLCLTTSQYKPLKVNPMGPNNTLDHLVNEVLFDTECNLVKNINYQVGDGSAPTQTINAIGSFEKGESLFPFEKGLVLTTSEVDYVSGPFRGSININRGNNPHRWEGDKDIKDAVKSAGGGPTKDMRITQLEFDFTPISDEISFEYLFASNSYSWDCMYRCGAAAMFAAWLVDSTTDEGKNIALIQGTEKPIAVNTIRDSKRLNIDCESSHPDYFWKHYQNNNDSPIESPIDFSGFTKPMKSPTVKVVPRRTYHIKLAIMDFCSNPEHSSAVFFNKGSFDIGTLNLGTDLLIENGNAVCTGETKTIYSGLSKENDLEITWYKDGVLIPNATQPDLKVTETGVYTVKANYTDVGCGPEGSVRIEFYPPLTTTIQPPVDLEVCRYATANTTVDLTEGTQNMLTSTDKDLYKLTYYTDAALSELITTPTAFVLDSNRTEQTIYITVQSIKTGCQAIFNYNLKPVEGDKPATPVAVKVCESYALPNLPANQKYFSQANGNGKELKPGTVLYAGTYQIYLYQDNGNGCFEETSFIIDITPKIEAMDIADQYLQCEYYQLPPLSKNNRYYITTTDKRIAVNAGTIIKENHTQITVVATSEDGLCVDEKSFTINYEPCPIPKGISPNGDGVNDRFDLTQHNVSSLKIFNRNGSEVYTFTGSYTNQWDGKNKNGQLLPSGTYYYIVQSFEQTLTGWIEIAY